jgi:hypothetical protein
MRLGLAALRVVQPRPAVGDSRSDSNIPNNDSPGLTATVARNKVVASHQVAALN